MAIKTFVDREENPREGLLLIEKAMLAYLAFTLDHDGPFEHPADFDAAYWRAAEAPRTTNLRGGTID